MKRFAWIWLAVIVTSLTAVSLASAQSQSLGDYARSVRKEKKPATVKQFDNDNLPTTQTLSVVGQAPENAPDASNPNAAAQSGDAQAVANKAPDKTGNQGSDNKKGDDKKNANDEWKTKINDQKQKLDLASRELDVMQREYRLRAAAMYADAGNRLRNAGSWDKEDEQYKKQIADKQKAVDDAKQQLEDLQEQARKAGLAAKDRE
jgi:hypothetical protein